MEPVILERIRDADLPRKEALEGFKKLVIKNATQRYIEDIGLQVEGIDLEFLDAKLKRAQRSAKEKYNQFKDSLHALYGEPK